MEISKVFLRFLSFKFFFFSFLFSVFSSISHFLFFLIHTHTFSLSLSLSFSLVWHAITCIWHIYNNNNMLLVDNRHLGPPRSLIRTYFFSSLCIRVIFIYTHIYIFIYLYNPKISVCVDGKYVFYVSPVCVFLSVQRSWTPFLSFHFSQSIPIFIFVFY